MGRGFLEKLFRFIKFVFLDKRVKRGQTIYLGLLHVHMLRFLVIKKFFNLNNLKYWSCPPIIKSNL